MLLGFGWSGDLSLVSGPDPVGEGPSPAPVALARSTGYPSHATSFREIPMAAPAFLPFLALLVSSVFATQEEPTPPSTPPTPTESPAPPVDEGPATGPVPVEAEPVPAGRKVLRVAEGVGNFLLADYTSVALHETVHWVVLKAYGTETEGITFIPFRQQVNVSDEVFASLSDQEIIVVALAPQVWDPLTAGLPRWIHRPGDDTWWLRFSSMYYLFNTMFDGASVLTMTWVEFIANEGAEKDVGLAVETLTDSRGAQAACYGLVTVLLGTNIALRWPHVTRSWQIVTRRSDTWDLEPLPEPVVQTSLSATRDGVMFRVGGRF